MGFPDEWTDYSSLALPPPDGAGGGSYFACALAARRFDHARTVVRIDAPVDRSRWLMAPQVVNAYFHPLLNEIVFPAASALRCATGNEIFVACIALSGEIFG